MSILVTDDTVAPVHINLAFHEQPQIGHNHCGLLMSLSELGKTFGAVELSSLSTIHDVIVN